MGCKYTCDCVAGQSRGFNSKTGQCVCEAGFFGERCEHKQNTCAPGKFGNDCGKNCDCSGNCDIEGKKCVCNLGMSGERCDKTVSIVFFSLETRASMTLCLNVFSVNLEDLD